MATSGKILKSLATEKIQREAMNVISWHDWKGHAQHFVHHIDVVLSFYGFGCIKSTNSTKFVRTERVNRSDAFGSIRTF